MRILFKVISVALVVTIPITSFCVGANIVTRMPDVYQYEFKATDAQKHFDVNKSNDEMGEFISDFMIGKQKKFQIITGDEDRPQVAFNENEMNVVANARKYMNIIAGIGILAAIIMIASFIILKKYEFDKLLRKQFKLSTFIYAIVLIVYLAVFFVCVKMEYNLGNILNYTANENDLLPNIISESLQKRLYLSTVVVSTIIIAIIGYITYKITEPKRMFSRNY